MIGKPFTQIFQSVIGQVKNLEVTLKKVRLSELYFLTFLIGRVVLFDCGYRAV
jgi:hypothetical protein